MPHKALLDPQGKAISKSMTNIGLTEITGVRMGKHIHLEVEAESEEAAKAKVEEACQKLLTNQITEYYEFTLAQAELEA